MGRSSPRPKPARAAPRRTDAVALQYLPASPHDAQAIRRLLSENALPSDDIAADMADFVVAKVDGALVGVAGVEIHGDAALLRSVAVAEAHRRSGVGRALCEAAMSRARRRGAKTIYLLTLTAAEYFMRQFDFAALVRTAAPKAIQMTHEFQVACPATATLLTRPL